MQIATWSLTQTAPGSWPDASAVDGAAEWLPAIVPGTLGAALRALALWAPSDVAAFDAVDVWYRTTITGDGEAILRFDQLATIADVYLDDRLILSSHNMFVAYEVEVALAGTHALQIAFRSLDAYLATKEGRARWQPSLAHPPALRFVRRLLLGRLPAWRPPIHAVGPTRGVALVAAGDLRIVERRVTATIEDGDGLLDLSVRLSTPVEGWVTARCGTFDFVLVDEGDGSLRGRAEVPNVARWWPHTHGTPALYPVFIYCGAVEFAIGKVGFRTIAVDRDADGKGFGLVVNGEPVFCRGACWTTADIVALPFSREAYLPALTLARDAGMNMIRVGGTMGYEGDAFYALCDELGLLVWQDFAFASFDYPAGDPAFRDGVVTEARQFLARTQASPSLAVLCGASEVAQQAAMLGLPATLWSNAIFDTLLPDIVAEWRPDVVYTPHSPWGGDLPFVAHEGISHYDGVGARRRSIEEARRAEVRFSAASLGFADEANVAHYTEALYGVDVAALRREEPERFLALAQATTAEVMEATYAEWRRDGSRTRGALVWCLRDLFDGAGCGIIDARGTPKPAFWALKRAFRLVGVVLTDENLNGLQISLINETGSPRSVKLTLTCLRDGTSIVKNAVADMTLEARRTTSLAASTLWGGFFDTTYAFKFGAPTHDVTVTRLEDATSGALIAEACHFPLGRGYERHDLGLAADVGRTEAGWQLTLSTRRFAQSVRIRCEGALPSDNWFHLPPGVLRVIDLQRQPARETCDGVVEALNGLRSVAFSSARREKDDLP